MTQISMSAHSNIIDSLLTMHNSLHIKTEYKEHISVLFYCELLCILCVVSVVHQTEALEIFSPSLHELKKTWMGGGQSQTQV